MSFFKPKLGIDLGTANTLVYAPGKGIILNEPSVVAVSQVENKVLAVGNEAKEMIGRTPDDIVAYRPMKDGVIANYRVTEAMLKYYIGKAMGRFNIFKPEVMISVPAGVTSTERRAVVEAAIKAGAKTAQVVKEPILAAIGAGIPIYDARGHMVVDIGGGTTDVAVISLGGIVTSTSVKCAGDKMDQAIADYVKKQFNLAIGDKTAEKIKIRVGAAVNPKEDGKTKVRGRDYMTGLPRTVEVSTSQIVTAIDSELKTMIKAIKDVFAETPAELAADIMDQGITMTGGSSQLTDLTELIHRRTGVKAALANEPLYCVAHGTGTVLEHLETYKKSVIAKK